MSIIIFHVPFAMFNFSCSIPILYVSTQLVSLVDSTQLAHSYDSTHLVFSGDLSELSLITYYLFLITFNYLDSNIIPFTSTWKMVKYNPNHIPDNMIG